MQHFPSPQHLAFKCPACSALLSNEFSIIELKSSPKSSFSAKAHLVL